MHTPIFTVFSFQELEPFFSHLLHYPWHFFSILYTSSCFDATEVIIAGRCMLSLRPENKNNNKLLNVNEVCSALSSQPFLITTYKLTCQSWSGFSTIFESAQITVKTTVWINCCVSNVNSVNQWIKYFVIVTEKSPWVFEMCWLWYRF